MVYPTQVITRNGVINMLRPEFFFSLMDSAWLYNWTLPLAETRWTSLMPVWNNFLLLRIQNGDRKTCRILESHEDSLIKNSHLLTWEMIFREKCCSRFAARSLKRGMTWLPFTRAYSPSLSFERKYFLICLQSSFMCVVCSFNFCPIAALTKRLSSNKPPSICPEF